MYGMLMDEGSLALMSQVRLDGVCSYLVSHHHRHTHYLNRWKAV